MPLPSDPQTPWPLPALSAPVARELARHAAWYSADPDQLRRAYGNDRAARPSARGTAGGVISKVRSFWGRSGISDPISSGRLQMHVPLAGDIARTSANLLFSEPATFDAGENTKAQERLEEMSERDGLPNTFLESAELAAALGGVYLRPAWDVDLTDHPVLTIVPADQAVPEFRWGVLTAVTFWRELERSATEVIRHLERHEPGVIMHGLYVGSPQSLGRKIELTGHTGTADLVDSLTDGDEIRVEGFEERHGLFVRHVRNIGPNKRHRGHFGRSDFQGVEDLFDALDETYTSWIRDIRLGRKRIMVDESYLTRGGARPQDGAHFADDNEVFTYIKRSGVDETTPGIKEIEFTLRTKEHEQTVTTIIRDAVSMAGYSPQSFIPRQEGGPESGVARQIMERKSFMTKGAKERYFKPQLEDIGEIMLALDKLIFRNDVGEIDRPSLSFSDSVTDSPQEQAKTVDMLARARSASIETRVRMVHPDWDQDDVEKEVAAIQAEEGAVLPDLLPGEDVG